jgi:hypothetical protein
VALESTTHIVGLLVHEWMTRSIGGLVVSKLGWWWNGDVSHCVAMFCKFTHKDLSLLIQKCFVLVLLLVGMLLHNTRSMFMR